MVFQCSHELQISKGVLHTCELWGWPCAVGLSRPLGVSPLWVCRRACSQSGGLSRKGGRCHVCVCVCVAPVRDHTGGFNRELQLYIYIYIYIPIALLSWSAGGPAFNGDGTGCWRWPCLSAYKPKLRGPKAFNLPFPPRAYYRVLLEVVRT